MLFCICGLTEKVGRDNWRSAVQTDCKLTCKTKSTPFKLVLSLGIWTRGLYSFPSKVHSVKANDCHWKVYCPRLAPKDAKIKVKGQKKHVNKIKFWPNKWRCLKFWDKNKIPGKILRCGEWPMVNKNEELFLRQQNHIAFFSLDLSLSCKWNLQDLPCMLFMISIIKCPPP